MNEGRAAFNIHGFQVLVEGDDSLIGGFQLHYGAFRVADAAEGLPTLLVRIKTSADPPLLIRTKGSRTGLGIIREDGRIALAYDEGAGHGLILGCADFLMSWPDKCKVHAGAVARDGKGYAFLAGQNTGKTATTLYFLKHGFSFLSDDWLLVDDRCRAFVWPKPIRVFDYNLVFDPEWCRRLFGWSAAIVRTRMKARLFLKRRLIPLLPHRMLRHGFDAILSRAIRDVPPSSVGAVSDPHVPHPLARVFWLERRPDVRELALEPIAAQEVLERAIHIYLYEWGEYLRWYHMDAARLGGIEHVDRLAEHMSQVLTRAFSGLRLTAVRIPQTLPPDVVAERLLADIERDTGG